MITQNVTPITPLPSFLAPERPAAVDNLVEVELPLLTEELDIVTSQINSTEANINAKESSVTEKYNNIQPHFDDIDLVAAAIASGNLPTIIDDTTVSTLKTWSSDKINTKIATAEDTKASNIASSSAIIIGTAGLGDYIHITGTTTITSFSNADSAGIKRTLIFDGILTLAHGTNLICPFNENIITSANTVIEVIAETTSIWRVISINGRTIDTLQAKAIPVNADEIMLADSASAWSLKKITWLDIKTALNYLFTPRVAITTNKAIARYSNTTGDLQNSAITIDDNGNIGTGTQSFNGFGGTGFKNYLINGNFDIWQYKDAGLTYPQTSSGYGSDDRWANLSSGSAKTHNRIDCTDVERVLFNASYFSRTILTSVIGVNNYVDKFQAIENVTKLAGKTVTLSFWAKADSNKNIAIELSQNFGSGGSPSSQVIGIGAQLIPLTTTWQKKTITLTIPSIVGKTLGTDGVHTSYTCLKFWLDAGSNLNYQSASLGQQSGTFDIAQVQLEEGSVATPFEQRPIGLELSLCQRYYHANLGPLSVNNIVYNMIYYPVIMRVTPTLTSTILGGSGTLTLEYISKFSYRASTTAPVDYKYTASAEL